MQKALIYCRVSSEDQKKNGHGLESQESRCRKYAKEKKYVVEEVFSDQAVSGGLFERKAMQELLGYLKWHKQEHFVIIFDDLKRFARDVEIHIKLRRLIQTYNTTVECLNFTFENSPEGRFIEVVIAAQGQLEREQNQRQVIQKMTVRMEKGYWCFQPPAGYHYKKCKVHGKLISPKSKEVTIIKQALEGFAHGRLLNQKQVVAFLAKKGYRGGKPIHLSTAKAMLQQSLYAGYYEYPKWNIAWRKAKHKAIISLSVYMRIQERLSEKMIVTKKSDTPDFPLRGLASCCYCGKLFTSSYSRGRNRYYPLYSCNDKNCTAKPKYIAKEKLEMDYIDLLDTCKIQPNCAYVLKGMLIGSYKKQIDEISDDRIDIQTKKEALEKQIETLTDRISKTSDEFLIVNYEKKINQLYGKLKELEKPTQTKEINIDIGTATQKTIELLENPAIYWKEADLQRKKLLHHIAFSSALPYGKNEGFGTVRKTVLFSLKEQQDRGKSYLVRYLRKNWNQILKEIQNIQWFFKCQKSLS
ncbi:MAG: resolvase [Flavobacteriaceae bacterium]|nr:MAG: resolvase [Flavobacteriaceae bacterium]